MSLCFQSNLHASEKVRFKVCTATSKVGSEKLQAVLAEVSLASPQERNFLIEMMRNKDNGCRKELELRLNELKDQPSSFRSNTGRHAVVSLGLLLDIPTAVKLVESEAASSGAPEWFSLLAKWDERSYSNLLRGWAVASAERMRAQMALPKASSELYGKLTIDERVQQNEKVALTPLMLELYLKDAAAKDAVSAEEFSALNVHYVAGNSGVRRIFSEHYIPMLNKHAAQWVLVFREERPWVQFQMIELMGRVGGSEMIRELLWLSQSHIDARMRSRASQALDNALSVR